MQGRGVRNPANRVRALHSPAKLRVARDRLEEGVRRNLSLSFPPWNLEVVDFIAVLMLAHEADNNEAKERENKEQGPKEPARGTG